MSGAVARVSTERGAALIVAVLFTAAVSVVVGGVALFALLDARSDAASHDHIQAATAVDAGIALALASLAAEPDLDAVRSGAVVSSASRASSLSTLAGRVDVPMLSLRLTRAQARLPSPWDAAVHRAYLWGRLGELVAAPAFDGLDAGPLVVVWVRGDDASGLGPDRLELVVRALTPAGAEAAATAVLSREPSGWLVSAVWNQVG